MINYLNKYFENNLITQKEIEKRTKISQSKLSLIFNNKRKLTVEELYKIAIAFNKI